MGSTAKEIDRCGNVGKEGIEEKAAAEVGDSDILQSLSGGKYDSQRHVASIFVRKIQLYEMVLV